MDTYTKTSINLEFLDGLANHARVWVYQSNRTFTQEESIWIEDHIEKFVTKWSSHSRDLNAKGGLVLNTFLVLAVDESQAGASGCSIDSSVHFIGQLAEQLSVDFMDRMTFSFLEQDKVTLLSRDDFSAAFQQGRINSDTLVFDPLVNTKEKLQIAFVKKLQDSWHKRMI